MAFLQPLRVHQWDREWGLFHPITVQNVQFLPKKVDVNGRIDHRRVMMQIVCTCQVNFKSTFGSIYLNYFINRF